MKLEALLFIATAPIPLTDLSTLANVVTTLATMGKNKGDQGQNDTGSGATPNGHTSSDGSTASVVKAFDTMAKMAGNSSVSLNQVGVNTSSRKETSVLVLKREMRSITAATGVIGTSNEA